MDTTIPSIDSPSLLPIARHRFTVDDYYRMAESGILSPTDRVELIEGAVVDMNPMGSKHAACLTRLDDLIRPGLVSTNASLRTQCPIHLSDDSEPEPDLAVVVKRADHYSSAHLEARDVLLLIEVAESSRTYDLTVKVPLYARFAVPEVRIVDLERDVVEVRRRPESGAYAESAALRRGESVQSTTLPTLRLDVAAVLG